MARARTTTGTSTLLLGLIAASAACGSEDASTLGRPTAAVGPSSVFSAGSPARATSAASAAGSPAVPTTTMANVPTAPVVAPTPAASSTLPPAAAPAPAKAGMPFPTNEVPAPLPTSGAAGAPATAPTAPTAPTTAAPSGAAGQPTIPAVKGDCPKFANGTVTFMGLGGINIVAGAKPASPTAPFVFYWHGTGSFAGEYASMAAAVSSGVTGEGGVLVSFQGTTGGDGLSGTSIFGKGDLDIGDQLIACAVRDHNIDPKRVFATGCSAGGLFSTNQAVLRSN